MKLKISQPIDREAYYFERQETRKRIAEFNKRRREIYKMCESVSVKTAISTSDLYTAFCSLEAILDREPTEKELTNLAMLERMHGIQMFTMIDFMRG